MCWLLRCCATKAFAESALVDPVEVNVGRAGAAATRTERATHSMARVAACHSQLLLLLPCGLTTRPPLRHLPCPPACGVSRCLAGAANADVVQEVEYVKEEAKLAFLLECLQASAPGRAALMDTEQPRP
jgi:hypothetical protein